MYAELTVMNGATWCVRVWEAQPLRVSPGHTLVPVDETNEEAFRIEAKLYQAWLSEFYT